MSCEEVRQDLSAYARDEINGERKDEIATHLEDCPDCGLELAGIQQVMESLEAADEQAVIRKAKDIIVSAFRARASDIHILPDRTGYAVRFRVDGVLHEAECMPRPLGQAVVTRLKVMSEMDAAERRVPQDGRLHVRHQDRDLDIRMTCMPTVMGEKITMRILDKGAVMIAPGDLGMNDGQLALIREFLSLPSGLFIATGPAGCGKSTLLYSMLNQLDADKLNICTIEDPVEYILPGIAQTHVNIKAGMGFAHALRYHLRSDPDVILCGEVRDLEAIATLMQATITGHLTMTTLHTSTAPDVFRRLLNMGVEPFLTADTVALVCAMRLVRRICEDCKEECEPTDGDRKWFRTVGVGSRLPDIPRLHRGAGCDECLGTGYRRRIGVFELLRMTDPLRDLVARNAEMDQIIHHLQSADHKTLVDHGLDKVRSGITTVAEVASMARGV